MTNLDSVLKSRDITLLRMIHRVKAIVFPVVMYRCEIWIIKKADATDAFKQWCWRRLLRVPWTARRSNQSILKEINPEYLSLMLKLKLQDFGHLMQRVNSLEKTLMLRKIESRRRGQQGMRRLDSITGSMASAGRTSLEEAEPRGDGGDRGQRVHCLMERVPSARSPVTS